MDVHARIASVFGVMDLPHGAFYDFDPALRFELGGDVGMERPIRRFLQAHERAVTVAQRAFADSTRIDVLLSVYGNPDHALDFERLQCCAPDLDETAFAYKTPLEEDSVRHWFQTTTDKDSVAEWLWLSVAKEMPITPSAPCGIYLVDFDARLFLHAYDDRGMDVVARDRNTLAPLYSDLGRWLLDYDRPRMDAMFS